MQKTDANYRFQVGDIHILALSDGQVPATTRLLYSETPEEVWDAYRERFPDYYDGKGFWVNLGAFLVKSGSRTVLVDTGLGPHATWPTLWPDSPGALKGPAQLMNDMKTKGIGTQEIDTVFITHLHGDHVGWNLTKDADSWKPTFPKARYLVQRADWERFTHPEFLDSGRREAAERNYLPLQELGVLELLEGDQEVAAGLTAIHTAGHTPGHMSMLIASGSERAIIIGDIVSSPMQVAEPDWPYAPDTNPAQALETRHRVLDLAEHGDMTLIAGHMHRPNWGRLMRWEGRRYWQAL
jgi:glyoxylase-like metal-dependent hydrolase (beta-lactamase superfamily II)